MIRYAIAAIALVTLPLGRGQAVIISVPGTTADTTKVHAGFFAGGSILSLSVTGTVDLIPQTGYSWLCNPDGSLVAPVGAFYTYANIGATNYPTTYGGDGINHYPGGGANYNGNFGIAGEQTTDTLDPDTIRFGSIVYTWVDTPVRSDWLFLGYGATITSPIAGANLYFAVNDGNHTVFPGANSGGFSVDLTPVPEPSSLILLACFAVGCKRWPGTCLRRIRA